MRATRSPDSGRQPVISEASPRVYHWMVATALALLSPLGAVGMAHAQQGHELPPINVSLPPSPNFNIQTAPETYPGGEMSVYGLRRHMPKYLDKDVQLKAYIIEVYECPAEQRKCNDDLAKKDKKDKKGKAAKAKKGAPPEVAAPMPAGGCRPCDQPHFFMADSPNTKKEHAILVADYPVKDWKTGKPKPLVVKAGAEGGQYVLTGTYAVNSMGGFAASDGLFIHKKLVDGKGNVITEGNAVLPPDAQDIKLDGKAAEKVGGARIDAKH